MEREEEAVEETLTLGEQRLGAVVAALKGSGARRVLDLGCAPFHLLASEGSVHTDRDHGWHMRMLTKLCEADAGLLLATSHTTVQTTAPESIESGTS
jgi:hypothetical protein